MPFKKGQSGNPKGRKKGAVGKAKTVSARELRAHANVRATEMLEALIRKAHNVVDEQLDEGNSTVAMWAIDRILGKQAKILPEEVNIKLDNMQGVIDAAQVIVEMVLLRKMSIEDGNSTIGLLNNYASFRAFERLDELRVLVDELKSETETKSVRSNASVPSWGRLSDAVDAEAVEVESNT